jgi:hypothetical protein
MRSICLPTLRRVRTHAIILTCNRPTTLQRCLQIAAATSGPEDVVTVLDDSGTAAFEANAESVRQYRRCWTSAIRHVPADWLHAAIESKSHGRTSWQTRSNPRDIAPVRNLGLVLARSMRSDETILIDDDVTCFDLGLTRRLLNDCAEQQNVILGARISGLSDLDTLSRLEHAMLELAKSSEQHHQDVWSLFGAPEEPDWSFLGGLQCPSGGYLGFRLPDTNVCAFPPGYNEDWLWSLLQRTEGVQVLCSSQVVVHDPPTVRRSSRADIIFELTGDLSVRSLAAVCTTALGTRQALSAMNHLEPPHCELPATRAAEIWEQYARLASDARHENVKSLAVYGAAAVGALVQARELDAYGRHKLREWSEDAVGRQADFAASIGDACSVASEIDFDKSHIRD